MANRQNQDELFLRWLSPSYWLVEGQLSSVRGQREKDTLEWARNMPEFEAWRRSEANLESKDRVLWIRGTLGVGKTIMAGYFIELLKCLHPNAVVAYFFCRSGQERLKTARDIIRTLAYQCVINDADARSVLDSLRTNDFRVNEEAHVGFLVEKLLQEPLNRTKNAMFIIIDGVDEADWTRVDNSERQPRPEMEAFIKAVVNIPSVHLLFVSRPKPDISRILPNMVTKSLFKTDNLTDIDAYVKKTVEGSERLKEHFLNEAVDPLEYFHRKSNGIFLWVVVVLHQLLQIKAGSVFRKYLNGFTNASGDMEKLYSGVLTNVQNDDQKWIKEILRWIVIGQRGLTINELKAVVEWSAQDNLPQFRTFLEVDCGALLHLVPTHSDTFNVQLIHETLHSFLVSQHYCPTEFYVDEKASQIYATRICLDILSTCDSEHNAFTEYAVVHWTHHLPTEKCLEEQLFGLIASLHRLFRPNGCNRWIQHFNVHGPATDDISFHEEENALKLVQDTLKLMPDDDAQVPRWSDKVRQEAVIRWRVEVLETPWKLGDDVGKAAAQIWLYADLPCNNIAAAFRLALKYYCRKHKIPLNDIAKLQDLAANDFTKICDHFDQKRSHKKRNMGIGFFVLRLWTDVINKFKADQTVNNDKWAQAYLGFAYLHEREYIKAKDLLQMARSTVYCVNQYDHCLEMLSLACQTKGDIDGAIEILKSEDSQLQTWTILGLAEMYASRGERGLEIESYRNFLRGLPMWYIQRFLANVYGNDGNQEKADGLYQQSSVDSRADASPRYFKDSEDKGVTTGIPLVPNNPLSMIPIKPSLDTQVLSPSPLRQGVLSKRINHGDAPSIILFNKDVDRQLVHVSLVHTLEHATRVHCFQFSPDGRAIAVVCSEGIIISDC